MIKELLLLLLLLGPQLAWQVPAKKSLFSNFLLLTPGQLPQISLIFWYKPGATLNTTVG